MAGKSRGVISFSLFRFVYRLLSLSLSSSTAACPLLFLFSPVSALGKRVPVFVSLFLSLVLLPRYLCHVPSDVVFFVSVEHTIARFRDCIFLALVLCL